MITKEQWDKIENDLTGMFASVKFQYGEHVLNVARVRTGEAKHELMVYVDGYIKGPWHIPDHKDFLPVIKDVWRIRKKAQFSPQRKAKMIKSLGKRLAKSTFGYMDKVTIYYRPDFTTAKSLVRQYKKLEGLTLIEREEVAAP
ncbi:hypothetical protein [Neptunomonas antarctica]|uniref:Uncharacterized protein n=1 Tax=Neptunomonas antarctica TaxID=619304 RepID=A0A1N7MQ58_9GAMM|nr:hypothetical protein [Neptunomonas antarctica]SIS88192.1 hypothetical protein SAMN05421760_106258 [Neptunomonas antarctica]